MNKEKILKNINKINEILKNKKLKNRTLIENVIIGPQITRYEIVMKDYEDVKKYKKIEEDLKIFFKNKNISIVLEDGVFIEFPNENVENIKKPKTINKNNKPILNVGKDFEFNNINIDLIKDPHVLIGGLTGSGKSTMLKGIVNDLSKLEYTIFIFDIKRISFVDYKDKENINVEMDYLEIVSSLEFCVSLMEGYYNYMEKMGIKIFMF